MSKHKDPLWIFFDLTDGPKKKAVCQVCKMEVSCKIERLRSHTAKCKVVYDESPSSLNSLAPQKIRLGEMDKYMLTIMVTFEQEYAIQKLFGRHGWEYSKITDEISLKKENSVEKVSSEPQPPVNQQSSVNKTVTVSSSTSKIVTSNDKVKDAKKAAVKISVISDVNNKLDKSISSEADLLDNDDEGDEDDDYGADTDTEHAEQSLESLGIVVKEEVDSEDDKTCENGADNISSIASNVKISGKGKRVAQTKVVTSNRKKRKLATCTVTSAEAEESVERGEREVKLEQLPAEDQEIEDPLAILETLPDIEHLSKAVSSETHDVETFLTGPSDVDNSGYSVTLAAYFCKDCQYTFPEEKYFTVHKRSGKCVFQCQFCDKKYTFKTFSKYQEHLKQHSLDWLEVSIKDEVISEPDTNENSKMSCNVLTSRSNKDKPVQPPRSQDSKSNTSVQPPGSQNSKSDTSVQPPRSQNSKSDTSVQPPRSQDSKSNTSVQPPRLKDSKSNEGRSSSSSSVESKQKQRIYCNICTYSTMLAYNMHRHQKSVHEERQWKCEKCSKTFKEIYYLRQHQRCVHENMKLLCEHCSKEFNSRQVLRRHKLVKHIGKSKYECNVCDKKFFEIWSYQGHMNKHSNARPYACLFCNKAFGYKSCLQRHSLSCSGQNLEKCKCTLCGKQLKSTASLKQHTKGVHGPKDLACVCGEQFSWNCSLARHKKSCKVLKN